MATSLEESEKLDRIKKIQNAGGISQPSLLSRFSQHYLVTIATSLDKSENKVQIDQHAPKALSYGEKIAKNWSSSLYPEIFD